MHSHLQPNNMAYFKSFLLSLTLSSLLVSLVASESAAVASGTIERVTKQHILATIPPGTTADTPQPFLTSPSGRYAASFVRSKTAPGAGGFGNDFCYVRVEDTSTGQSEWESECTPMTDANACTLAFTEAGLEVFDGSRSTWSTEADGDHVEELTLVDQGDMRIIDKDGELAWKASDDARANQGCGLAGLVGLAPESPPFAGPIGGGTGPFGQQTIQQQQIVGDLTQSAAAPVADGQQQIVGDSLQSAATAPPADEQQTVGDCPQSAAVAPVADGQQQQTASESPTQSAAAPTAGEQQQQQAVGDSPQQPAVAPAADGQQQTAPETPTQSAAAPAADEQQQQSGGDSPQQPAVAPAADGQQQQQAAAETPSQPAAALPAIGGKQRTLGGAAAAAPTAYQQQVQQGLGGGSGQQLGFSAQPLVDNSPFDSGSFRGLKIWGGASSAVAALLLVHALLL